MAFGRRGARRGRRRFGNRKRSHGRRTGGRLRVGFRM